jgi:hypothetical protein
MSKNLKNKPIVFLDRLPEFYCDTSKSNKSISTNNTGSTSKSKMKSWTDFDDESSDESSTKDQLVDDDESSFEPNQYSNRNIGNIVVHPRDIIVPILDLNNHEISNNKTDINNENCLNQISNDNNMTTMNIQPNTLSIEMTNLLKQKIKKMKESNEINTVCLHNNSNVKKLDIGSLFSKKNDLMSKSSESVTEKNENFNDFDDIDQINFDHINEFKNELDIYLSTFSLNEEIQSFFKDRLTAFFKILVKFTTFNHKKSINLGYITYHLLEKLNLKKLDKNKYDLFYCHILYPTFHKIIEFKNLNKNCYFLNEKNNEKMNVFLEKNNKILPMDFLLNFFSRRLNIQFHYSISLNHKKEDCQAEFFIYFTGYTKNN